MRILNFKIIAMKKLNKNIKIIVEKTDTGFSAYCEEYPIFTTGRTVSELLNNAFEATQLYFEDQFKVFVVFVGAVGKKQLKNKKNNNNN